MGKKVRGGGGEVKQREFIKNVLYFIRSLFRKSHDLFLNYTFNFFLIVSQHKKMFFAI